MTCLPILADLAANAAEARQNRQVMPEWELQHWFNSHPLKLSDLRGKVLLLRWWTAPDCPYCVNTAPTVNEFRPTTRSAN